MAEKFNAEELALQAYLYASGELAEEERATFEQRLAVDQAAREAVAEAVQLSASVHGAAARPDPAYREHVRQRLSPSGWKRLLAPRKYRGHPMLWSAAGAAAAMLLALTVLRPSPDIQVIVREIPVQMQPEDDDLLDVSFIWAELSNPDHAVRAQAEETERKFRQEDRRQTRRGSRQPAIRQ